MGLRRPFDIKELKPFHREGDRMPQPAFEKTDEISRLDQDLKPDELAYINHYIAYADILLSEPDEEEEAAAPVESARSNVVELPRSPERDDDGNGKAA